MKIIEYISDSIGCSMDFVIDTEEVGVNKTQEVINEFMGRLKRKQGGTEQANILKELKHSPKYSYCRGH